MKIFLLASSLNSSSKKYNGLAVQSFGTSSRAYKNTKETSVQDNLVLTNTWLFRDDLDWDGLVKYMQKTFKNKGKVHIHSVASSDGSEAFTLAMTIDKILGQKCAENYFPIEATDRDENIIKLVKSGFINLRFKDIAYTRENGINPKDYFVLSKEKLSIDNDAWVPGMHTYKISSRLKKSVKFEQCDLLEKLKKVNDNSNTVVLCRNVTPYLSSEEVLKTALTASKNLKKGSLFVIGKYDSNTNIADYLKNLGFVSVMRNVFQKVV